MYVALPAHDLGGPSMLKYRAVFGLLCLLASACGSDSTSSETAGGTSAADASSVLYPAGAATSVNVLLTDAPATLSSLSAVNVSISRAQLHVVAQGNTTLDANAWGPNGNPIADPNGHGDDDGAGDDKPFNPFGAFNPNNPNMGLTDPNDASIDADAFWNDITLAGTTFNLLALQGNVTQVLGGLDLPSGVLTQIRLFIDPNGTNNVVLADSTVCTLDVNSVIGRGVRINEAFPHTLLADGNTNHFTVDFDVQNSLSQDGPCAFSLRPVFHLRHHAVDTRDDGGWAKQHSGRGSSDPNAYSGDANRIFGSGTRGSGSTINGGVGVSGNIGMDGGNAALNGRGGRGRLIVPTQPGTLTLPAAPLAP
jgi:post-segregation antitoxin (ccd killing protein)